MNGNRMGIAVVAACVLGLGACNRTRDVSDTELTTLLRVERASATDPKAPLDAGAINCLRAWSGDADLIKELQPASAGEAAKASCKPKIDGWLADATRNPDKLSFKDVSAPPAVRRAAVLLGEHQPTQLTGELPSKTAAPPAAMMPAPPHAPLATNSPALGTAVSTINELDDLCTRAKQQGAAGGPNAQTVTRYANYCQQSVLRLRSRVTALEASGDPKQAQALADNAQRLLDVGRRLEAQQSGGSNPPPSNQ